MGQDSLTDWIQLGLTILGGVYGLWLFRQSNQEKRNQYVAEIMNRFYDDKEIRTIVYAVDSGRDVCEIKFQGKLEKEADKTIKYLDYVGYLLKDKKLRRTDLRPFKYEMSRIFKNSTMQDYIKWLVEIGVSLENLDYLKKSIEKHWD
jgi:hypothetical protein